MEGIEEQTRVGNKNPRPGSPRVGLWNWRSSLGEKPIEQQQQPLCTHTHTVKYIRERETSMAGWNPFVLAASVRIVKNKRGIETSVIRVPPPLLLFPSQVSACWFVYVLSLSPHFPLVCIKFLNRPADILCQKRSVDRGGGPAARAMDFQLITAEVRPTC